MAADGSDHVRPRDREDVPERLVLVGRDGVPTVRSYDHEQQQVRVRPSPSQFSLSFFSVLFVPSCSERLDLLRVLLTAGAFKRRGPSGR